MARITIAERLNNDIDDVIKRILNSTRDNKFKMNTQELLSLYRSPEEQRCIDVAMACCNTGNIEDMYYHMLMDAEVIHPVTNKTIKTEVLLRLSQPDGPQNLLWPRNMGTGYVREDCDWNIHHTLQIMVNEMATEALTRGIVQFVLNFLKGLNDSYLARYLFPPWQEILQRADHSEIASKVAKLKSRPPEIPSYVTHEIRQQIKFVYQWFTVQSLLGTFDKRNKHHIQTKDEINLAMGNDFVLDGDLFLS